MRWTTSSTVDTKRRLQNQLTKKARKTYNEVGNPYSWEDIEEAGLYDFRVFLAHVWAYLSLPVPTPVQNDIALYLQLGPKRSIIQAFRGVGKSWITVAFVLWLLLLNPQLKIEVVSASGKLAETFVKFCLQIIRGMPLVQHLKPRRDQWQQSTMFEVGPATDSRDPSVKAAGITGGITGTRADVIIPDDVEIPSNSYTVHLREKLSEQVKEFDAILKPGGRIVYLGTPQVEESLYPKLRRERGYNIRVWTSEIPKDQKSYHGNLAPFVLRMIERGAKWKDPVDPLRFPEEELYGKRLSYGVAGYALQFLLDTTPADAEKHPLKLKDCMVLGLDSERGYVQLAWGNARELTLEDLPAGGFDGDHWFAPAWKSDEMAKWGGTVMAIDPSGRGKDETAYAIVRYLHGNLYLVASGGFTDGFGEETLKELAAVAARHQVNPVIAEDNYGGGMFRKLLEPHLAKYNGKAGRFDDEWDAWSSGQKELRILDVLQPIFGSHKLVIDRSVIEADRAVQEKNQKYSLIYQITRITREKGAIAHDDRVEALAMACAYWVERMNRDGEKEHKRFKRQEVEKALKEFHKHVFGIRKQSTQDSRRRNRIGNRLPFRG